MDLAIHTAKPGRSRAIDRYAKGVPMPAGSDEAHARGNAPDKEDVLMDAVAWNRSGLSSLAQDPKFATAIYRAAVHNRVMERVVYA